MIPDRADVLVVGGGIIGLTLARELVARGARATCVVLEKEPDLGRHASGRNSGVLHAGIYYAPDSAKARTCLAGNRLMRAYCQEKGLPLLEAGKVIVARSEAELPTLDELHRRATANGARVALRGRAGARRARADGAHHRARRSTRSTRPWWIRRRCSAALRAELEAAGARIVDRLPVPRPRRRRTWRRRRRAGSASGGS